MDSKLKTIVAIAIMFLLISIGGGYCFGYERGLNDCPTGNGGGGYVD